LAIRVVLITILVCLLCQAGAEPLREPQIVEFNSGSLTLKGYLYRPNGQGPFPAMLWNHGSEKLPGSRADLANFYVSHGFMFFVPHRHGHGLSPGDYIVDLQDKARKVSPSGVEYQHRVIALHEKYLEDTSAAFKWFAAQPDVDTNRMYMSGVSYGGIQTLLAAEKDIGAKAYVPFAPAAMSWAGMAELRSRLTKAVLSARQPIFLLQATNDYNLGPSEMLGAELKRKGSPNQSRVYPQFGETAKDGHGGFGCRGTNVWGNDVLAFLSTARSELRYPYTSGKLSFPKDEGLHYSTNWPMTVAEWHAHYAHLTSEDGKRYLLFTTFITYDPVEFVIGGKFPHAIATLIDVENRRTYHHRDHTHLKKFEPGHADVETVQGDYFRWKGDAHPFEYDFHVGWKDEDGDVAVTTALKMTKPPLVVNGSGFVQLPKGDSGYYSQTRLEAKGELFLNGKKQRVSGIEWIDRQWLGMSFAANLDYYYDWWALQLENNEEAILFRIKDFTNHTVVMPFMEINHADGTREHVDKFSLVDVDTGWKLSAPSAGWEMNISRVFNEQKIWQDCDIAGTIRGKAVKGLAVAELARSALEEFRSVMHPRRSESTGGR
jgi:carboxymethylenebutenolidase